MSDVHGDHPPFTPVELAEIRRLADEKRQILHAHKNEASSIHVRDALTTRLQSLERIAEKTR